MKKRRDTHTTQEEEEEEKPPGSCDVFINESDLLKAPTVLVATHTGPSFGSLCLTVSSSLFFLYQLER